MSCSASGCKFLVEVCKEPPDSCQSLVDFYGPWLRAVLAGLLMASVLLLVGFGWMVATANPRSKMFSLCVFGLMGSLFLAIAFVDFRGWVGIIPVFWYE